MKLARQAMVIVVRDLRTELRGPKVLATMAFFALIVLLLFVFGIDTISVDVQPIFPVMLWTGVFFSGTLGLGQVFDAEMASGGLDGLLLAPIGRSGIYFAKLVGTLLFVWVTAAVMVPLLFIFFQQPFVVSGWRLTGLIGLISLGFVTVGTLVSAIAAQTRQKGILLPILLFPLTIPLIMAAVELTDALFTAGTWAAHRHWLQLLLAYDTVFLLLSPVLFEFVVEVQ